MQITFRLRRRERIEGRTFKETTPKNRKANRKPAGPKIEVFIRIITILHTKKTIFGTTEATRRGQGHAMPIPQRRCMLNARRRWMSTSTADVLSTRATAVYERIGGVCCVFATFWVAQRRCMLAQRRCMCPSAVGFSNPMPTNGGGEPLGTQRT